MQSVEVAAQPEMALVENVEVEAVAAATTEEPRAVIATEEAAAEPQRDEASAANAGEMEQVPEEAEEKPQDAADEVKGTEEAPAQPEAAQVSAAEVAPEAAEAEKAEEMKEEEPPAVEEKAEMAADQVATGEVDREAKEEGNGKASEGADVEMRDAPLQQEEAAATEGQAMVEEGQAVVTEGQAEGQAAVDEAATAMSTEVAAAEEAPAETCSQSNKFDSMQVDGTTEEAKAPTPTTDAPATSGDETAAAAGEVGEQRAAVPADVDDNRPSACDGAASEVKEIAAAAEEVQPVSEEPTKSTEAAADAPAAMEVDAGEQQVPAEDVKPSGLDSTPVKGLSEMETDTPEKAPQIVSEPQTRRPLTPIFQFIHDTRAKIQQDFNVRRITDVAKIAKGLFEALSDEERQFYEEQYEERKRAFEAFMATEQGEEFAKEQARKGAPSRSSRRAAPKPAMKRPKAKPAAVKKGSKVLRPTPPVVQYMRENRYRIMAEHGVKRAIDLPKKAKELFDQLPEEQKKTFQDRYEQQKVAWTQFKASEKTAIKQYKTQLSKQKEQEEGKKKAQLGSAFRAGAKPPPARAAGGKRSRKAAGSSAPSRSAKQAKVTEVPVVLSPAGLERAKKMGVAPSGVPYARLLEKLLATPHMETIAEDEALDSLKKFKGNVNLARNAIKSKVIEL